MKQSQPPAWAPAAPVAAYTLEQILAVGRGEPPAHVINPEAIATWRMNA